MDTLFELKTKPAKEQEKERVFDICDALQSPIIMYPSPWQSFIPRRMIETIPVERMKALANDEYTATIVECAVYLYPASLEAPLDHDWTEIYLYCCTHYMKLWQQDIKIDKDICVDTLDDHRTEMLHRLCRWMYDKRRKSLKENMRAQKKALPDTTEEAAELLAEPVEETQLDFFAELEKVA